MLSFKHTREDEEFHSCEVVKRTNIVHVNSDMLKRSISFFMNFMEEFGVSLRGKFKTRQRPKTQVYDK